MKSFINNSNEKEKLFLNNRKESNATSSTCDNTIIYSSVKIKKHVTFAENFVEEIEVESWKKYNEDISLSIPYPWELEAEFNKKKKKEKIKCFCILF